VSPCVRRMRRLCSCVVSLSASLGAVQSKVWVKPSSEMSFLYGNHITKTGVARMTEDIAQYAGVVVLSMSNTPLGFGVAAQSTERARDMDPAGVAVLHQADIGEYLREEATLT
jgi:60S ribosome subunit biogenesis protein NIP7